MDDEARILLELSDPEWDRRAARIEREFRREQSRAQPRRESSLHVAVSLVALIAAALLIVRVSFGASTPRRPSAPIGTSAVRPFEDTPARDWPVAAIAVVRPEVVPAGSHSPAEVAAALDRVAEFLLRARASQDVISGQAGFTGSVLRPTRLAPGNRLLEPVRVIGTTWAGNVKSDLLQIQVNMVWGYAVGASYPTGNPNHVILIHDNVQLEVGLSAGAPVHVDHAAFYAANVDCGFLQQYLFGLPRANDPGRLRTPSWTNAAAAYDPSDDITHHQPACR